MGPFGEVEGIPVARKVWQPMAVSIRASAARRRTMYQTSVRDSAEAESNFLSYIADLNSGPLRSSAMPAALI